MKYAAKICGIRPHSHICIKPAYRESDSICGKIYDMHTFGKYANNAEIAYCLLYTSDAADEEDSVDLGGRRIIKKKLPHKTGMPI